MSHNRNGIFTPEEERKRIESNLLTAQQRISQAEAKLQAALEANEKKRQEENQENKETKRTFSRRQ